MLTFYAGVAVEILLSLAAALLYQGVRHYHATRSWRLAEERALLELDAARYTTRPLVALAPSLESSPDAL